MFRQLPDAQKSDALLKSFREQVVLARDECDLKRIIHESGVLWAWIPTWMGGVGLHPMSLFGFAYELSQYSLGLTNIIGAHYAAIGILSSGRAYSKIRRLVQEMKLASPEHPGIVCLAVTEPNAGSDFENADHLRLARVMTTATPKSYGYEISGQKIYVSNAPWAKWIVFSAYQDIKRPLDTGLLGLVEISREGVSLGKKESKLGQNICTNCMIFFDQVKCSSEEIFANGNPHFSRFLIEESLAPGRASIAAMSLGIMKSLERFGAPADLQAGFEKLEEFFIQIKKTHLNYRHFPMLDRILNEVTHLPLVGSTMSEWLDTGLASELVRLGKPESYLGVHESFKMGSRLKAEQTQAMQLYFEKLLSESSYSLIADPFFQAQLKDARLLEIIEGTTEVCMKDAGISRANPNSGLTLEESSFGFLNPELESAALNWIQKEFNAVHDQSEWVKNFFDSEDIAIEASTLYAIAYEQPELALKFFLKVLKLRSGTEVKLFIDRNKKLSLSEKPDQERSLKLLAFSGVTWTENSPSVVLNVPAIENYLLPIVLLGAADRAWQYAYDYALERYQGGKLIIHHPEVFELLARSQNVRKMWKAQVKNAIEINATLDHRTAEKFFRFARDVAQVLGGMSYMEEHPISRLYLEIITLANLSLQK